MKGDCDAIISGQPRDVAPHISMGLLIVHDMEQAFKPPQREPPFASSASGTTL